jgi:gamma-glutamylcyclotransferase (GGCT)/AIG2-like uncharacterized protein YtfP
MLERYNGVYLGAAITHSRYHIYKVGWFPGMTINEDTVGGVLGELYEVTEECLVHLDHYEGTPDLFERKEIEISDGSRAVAYLYAQSFAGCERFEDGIWHES